MKIPIVNPLTTLTETTYLTADYTSGTSLTVKSSKGFSDDDLILAGYPGQELSEITDLTATPPSDTTLTITAFDFPHGKDTPIYKVLFDQAEIHESTDGTSYSLLTTVNLTYDKLVTVYDHLSGNSTYYYKIKLVNSNTGNKSNFSDAQTGTGWPRKSVGRMLRNVRRNLKDLESKKYEDWEIMTELKNAADEVLSEIPNAYWTLREDSRTTTASTNEYYLPTDYRSMLYLLYTYDPNSTGGKKYPLEYKPKSAWLYDDSDQEVSDDDYLDSWTEAPGDSDYPNGYFRVYPTPESAGEAMELWYFREEPEFDSYGDVTACPLPQAYENYATAALTDDNEKRAMYEGKFARNLRQLKQRQRREFSPKTMRRWHGRDPVNRLYGRGAVKKTQQDIIDYWD